MCKYSLEGYGTRKATAGETLVANEHVANAHGCFTQPGEEEHGTLTCVRAGTVLTIEKLELNGAAVEFVRLYSVDRRIMDYVGKHIVVSLIDGRSNPRGWDALLVKGTRVLIPLMLLKRGTEAYVGVKKEITLDDKLGLDAKSLRAIAADEVNEKQISDGTFEPVNPMVIEPPTTRTFRQALNDIIMRRERVRLE